jgi:hypothetical protein
MTLEVARCSWYLLLEVFSLKKETPQYFLTFSLVFSKKGITLSKSKIEMTATTSLNAQDIKAALMDLMLQNPSPLRVWVKEAVSESLELTFETDLKTYVEQHLDKYSLNKARLKKVQELWADAPSAEVLIADL